MVHFEYFADIFCTSDAFSAQGGFSFSQLSENSSQSTRYVAQVYHLSA